jgi:hypothetical protein
VEARIISLRGQLLRLIKNCGIQPWIGLCQLLKKLIMPALVAEEALAWNPKTSEWRQLSGLSDDILANLSSFLEMSKEVWGGVSRRV